MEAFLGRLYTTEEYSVYGSDPSPLTARHMALSAWYIVNVETVICLHRRLVTNTQAKLIVIAEQDSMKEDTIRLVHPSLPYSFKLLRILVGSTRQSCRLAYSIN